MCLFLALPSGLSSAFPTVPLPLQSNPKETAAEERRKKSKPGDEYVSIYKALILT
jgi:hypothetical protein